MTSKTVYIYGLVDPQTEEIRYVGKTSNLKDRYSSHLFADDVNRHKCNWIKLLKKNGHKPRMIILEKATEKNWEDRERFWIKHGYINGWKLTNISKGGDTYSVYDDSSGLFPVHLLYPWVDKTNIELLNQLDQETIKQIANEFVVNMIDLSFEKIDDYEIYIECNKYINNKLENIKSL